MYTHDYINRISINASWTRDDCYDELENGVLVRKHHKVWNSTDRYALRYNLNYWDSATWDNKNLRKIRDRLLLTAYNSVYLVSTLFLSMDSRFWDKKEDYRVYRDPYIKLEPLGTTQSLVYQSSHTYRKSPLFRIYKSELIDVTREDTLYDILVKYNTKQDSLDWDSTSIDESLFDERFVERIEERIVKEIIPDIIIYDKSKFRSLGWDNTVFDDTILDTELSGQDWLVHQNNLPISILGDNSNKFGNLSFNERVWNLLEDEEIEISYRFKFTVDRIELNFNADEDFELSTYFGFVDDTRYYTRNICGVAECGLSSCGTPFFSDIMLPETVTTPYNIQYKYKFFDYLVNVCGIAECGLDSLGMGYTREGGTFPYLEWFRWVLENKYYSKDFCGISDAGEIRCGMPSIFTNLNQDVKKYPSLEDMDYPDFERTMYTQDYPNVGSIFSHNNLKRPISEWIDVTTPDESLGDPELPEPVSTDPYPDLTYASESVIDDVFWDDLNYDDYGIVIEEIDIPKSDIYVNITVWDSVNWDDNFFDHDTQYPWELESDLVISDNTGNFETIANGDIVVWDNVDWDITIFDNDSEKISSSYIYHSNHSGNYDETTNPYTGAFREDLSNRTINTNYYTVTKIINTEDSDILPLTFTNYDWDYINYINISNTCYTSSIFNTFYYIDYTPTIREIHTRNNISFNRIRYSLGLGFRNINNHPDVYVEDFTPFGRSIFDRWLFKTRYDSVTGKAICGDTRLGLTILSDFSSELYHYYPDVDSSYSVYSKVVYTHNYTDTGKVLSHPVPCEERDLFDEDIYLENLLSNIENRNLINSYDIIIWEDLDWSDDPFEQEDDYYQLDYTSDKVVNKLCMSRGSNLYIENIYTINNAEKISISDDLNIKNLYTRWYLSHTQFTDINENVLNTLDYLSFENCEITSFTYEIGVFLIAEFPGWIRGGEIDIDSYPYADMDIDEWDQDPDVVYNVPPFIVYDNTHIDVEEETTLLNDRKFPTIEIYQSILQIAHYSGMAEARLESPCDIDVDGFFQEIDIDDPRFADVDIDSFTYDVEAVERRNSGYSIDLTRSPEVANIDIRNIIIDDIDAMGDSTVDDINLMDIDIDSIKVKGRDINLNDYLNISPDDYEALGVIDIDVESDIDVDSLDIDDIDNFTPDIDLDTLLAYYDVDSKYIDVDTNATFLIVVDSVYSQVAETEQEIDKKISLMTSVYQNIRYVNVA